MILFNSAVYSPLQILCNNTLELQSDIPVIDNNITNNQTLKYNIRNPSVSKRLTETWGEAKSVLRSHPSSPDN